MCSSRFSCSQESKGIKNILWVLQIITGSFVVGFAHIASPLNAATKKGIEWTQSCAEAFDKLRRALASAPILAYPDFS